MRPADEPESSPDVPSSPQAWHWIVVELAFLHINLSTANTAQSQSPFTYTAEPVAEQQWIQKQQHERYLKIVHRSLRNGDG